MATPRLPIFLDKLIKHVIRVGATEYPMRSSLNLTGATVTDDEENDQTTIVFSGGGGGGGVLYTLDAGSASLSSGDYVCLLAGTTDHLTITRVTDAAIAAAGGALGFVVDTYAPGATDVNVAIGGTAPASVTGLGAGVAGEVYIDTATARGTRVQASAYKAGYVDTAGKQIIAPHSRPLSTVNVLESPFNFDNSGATYNDAKLQTLLVYLGTVGRAKVYFPAGDYKFADDIGPWPGGTVIEGDGYSGTLVSGSDPGYPGNSANRYPNAVSGTRILCEGENGFLLGHHIGGPAVSAQGRACTVLRHMEVLGRKLGGALPACITDAVLSEGTVTVTTNSPHGYIVGDKVIVRRVPGNPAANTRGFVNTDFGAENTYYLEREISRVGTNDFDIPQAEGLAGPIAGGAYGPALTLTTTNVRIFRGQTWVDCTSAVNILPYGARVIITGTGTSLDNNEWHIQPMAGYPGGNGETRNSFVVCQSGGGGTNTVVATGTYTGPGTVTYGGHCLKTTRCNQVGVEFLSEQAVMQDVRIGGFKYLASIDGALVSWMQRVAFDGVSFDLPGYGYDDRNTELGVDGASSVRVGSFKFYVRNSTNANFIDGCQFNGTRNGILAVDGIGLHVSNTNSETGGARCILSGIQTFSWDNAWGEGCQSASILLISPYDVPTETAPSSANISLSNWWPDPSAPLIWAYDSTARAGCISLHNVTFTDFIDTTPFAPIMVNATSDLAQIEVFGCTLPPNGDFKGALTNIEIDLPTDRVGNSIAQTKAAEAALDIRPIAMDGTPGLMVREGPRIFQQLGMSNGYPRGSVGGTGAKSDGWKNRIFSPETGVTAVQDRDGAFWIKLGSSAAATKVAQVPIATSTVDFFLGNFAIEATVLGFHNSDPTKMVRAVLRRAFHYNPNDPPGDPDAIIAHGPSVIVEFEDTDGSFTIPTIEADNTTSAYPTTFPSFCVSLTGYTGDPTYWAVYYRGLWTGV